jgi:hypothetical protein
MCSHYYFLRVPYTAYIDSTFDPDSAHESVGERGFKNLFLFATLPIWFPIKSLAHVFSDGGKRTRFTGPEPCVKCKSECEIASKMCVNCAAAPGFADLCSCVRGSRSPTPNGLVCDNCR